MKKTLSFLLIFLVCSNLFAQLNIAPAWEDFASKRTSGNWGTTTLTDFSYAGYNLSNSPLPNTSNWNVVNVRDHGAVPDDGRSDNEGIQNAINAAQNSNQPTVVQFESGRYTINIGREGVVSSIYVTRSNIVLKGTGSGNGGTEIFCQNSALTENEFGDPADDDFAFIFRSQGGSPQRTTVTRAVNRGSFKINVANSSSLNAGEYISIKQDTPSNREPNGVTYPLNSNNTEKWTRINNFGLTVREIHKIKSKSGNELTLENPVLMNLPTSGTIRVLDYNPIENVGLESIKFAGNWHTYGETFIHHKDGDNNHDQGWSGLYFETVANSWIRDCEFRNWNEAIEFDRSFAITVRDSRFTGKKAHISFSIKQSTNFLLTGIRDTQNQHHGPGFQISTGGHVCTDYVLNKNQSIDLHGANPYAILFDNMNGILHRNGGSSSNYPNGGPYNAFWNFVQDSDDNNRTIDFWKLDSNPKQWTIANPVFAGFTTKKDTTITTLQNTGKNESVDAQVYPKSLFEAQYQLRTYDGYMSASNSKSNRPAARANDGRSNTAWETNGRVANQWLMLDLGTPKTVNEIFIDERSRAIGQYRIQYWGNGSWNHLKSGTNIGSNKTITFNEPQRLTIIRLFVRNKRSGSNDSDIKINTFRIEESDGGVDYTPPPGYTLSVDEGQTIPVSGTMNVAFGANGQFRFLYNQTSNVTCNRNTFGGDPTPGVVKKCFFKSKGDIAIGTYFLKNKASGNYLDSDGTTIRVKAKAGGLDQRWKLAIPADLHYNIDNEFSGRGVLDANSNGVVQGSSVESPSTANDKEWTVESLGNNTYRFKNVQQDRFLAEKSSSNAIEHTNWNGDRAQWILEPISSSEKTNSNFKKETSGLQLMVYPNPSINGEFTIDLKGMKSSEISIYNILGALVYSTKTSDNKIQVSTDKLFESGIYLIRVIDDASHVYSKKLIIQ